jgi:hypothetical protein
MDMGLFILTIVLVFWCIVWLRELSKRVEKLEMEAVRYAPKPENSEEIGI